MQFTAPSVNTRFSEETGLSSQNTGKHISVALANPFVRSIFPHKPEVDATRGCRFPFQFVCSAWPMFCLPCYEHSTVLCEV